MSRGPGMRAGSDEPPRKFSWAEQKVLLKSFIRYYPRHRRLAVLDLTFVVLMALASVATPKIVFDALRSYLPEKNFRMLIVTLAILLFLTGFRIVAEYILARWGHTLGVRMEADMRLDLFSHLQKLSFGYFDKTKTGHIMSRISNDLTMIAEVAHHGPEDVISALLMLGGGLGVMLAINPMLTLLMLVPVPFAIFWTGFYQPRMREKFRRVRKEVAEINSQVENSIQGVREVKSYTNEKNEIRKFDHVNVDYRTARENVFSTMAVFHSGMMFLFSGYSVIFIAIAICLMYLYPDRIDFAVILTFYMYSGQITGPVLRLVGFVDTYMQGMSAFERFHEIMMERPAIEDQSGALASLDVPLRGEIAFEHVSFRYESMNASEPWILDDIDVAFPAGKITALVGESGAGKTTLASLIPRFYEVGAGTVRIDGIDVRDFQQKLLRSNVGIVQQTPYLFDTTIRENILFGRTGASEQELIEAARSANIYDFITSLPDGFDSNCGENGVRLSGGQKQRISIARVFLKNPPVLIFDEATSSLDNQSEALVQESMERLCHNRTTIIIAHRLSTIKNADFICCMKHGKIVEHGSHAELLALNGYYKELYTMHSF